MAGPKHPAYYSVLADVGAGSWHPDRDAKSWLRFNLIAHHMQAQTVLRRVDDAAHIWTELEKVVSVRRLPERSVSALYSAALGLKFAGRSTKRTRMSNWVPQTQGPGKFDVCLDWSMSALEPV